MGLLRMAARTAVVAGTATAVPAVLRTGRTRSTRRRTRPSTTSSRRPTTQGSRLPPRAPAEEDPLVEGQKLATLHEQGVLTDEEFTAAKAKALGL